MYLPPHNPAIVAEFVTFFGKKGDDKLSQWSSIIGIVTAITGNILISFALNIQRFAHIRIDQEYTHTKKERKARKKLPKAIRNYGTAVRQEQAAEERARLNATAPGPGLDNHDDESSDDNELSPLTGSLHSDNTDTADSEHDDSDHGRKSYLSSPCWWLGISLMAVGEAGNFLAYGFAPASIVSPLGVVALISNCLIAPLFLKEHFRSRDFWGVLVAVGGAVTIVFSARTSEAKLGPDKLWLAIRRWEFLTYVLITLVLIIALMIASPRYGRRTILIDLGLVGLFGGYTALSTKGVAAMLSGTLFRAFTFPITYVLILVLIASAIMQIRYINRALSNFDSTQVIPTQFVLFTLSVIVGSAVLYRDFEKADLEHVAKFVAGCLLTFSGVWLITSGRKNGDDDEDDDDEYPEDETIRLIDEESIPDRRVSFSQKHAEVIDTPSKHSNGLPSVNGVAGRIPRSLSTTAATQANSSDTAEDQSATSLLPSPHDLARPKTPRQNTQLTTNSDDTPFYTPASVPLAISRPAGLPTNHSDSALVTPITPTRPSRVSPSRPTLILPDGEVYETPPSGILRSARGSIQRLIPAPLIPPLPGALNTMVAESLLRGIGSPRFARDSLRRRRSGRDRNVHRTQSSAVPQSAIESPPISRWTTVDGDVPDTPRTAISDYIPSDDQPSRRRRSRLASFGDSLTDFFNKSKKPNQGPRHDEN